MKKSIGAKTILYPTPVLIVGTYDKNGKPNAMTAAWGGICCSSPPCVTVSLRKATYSYNCLVASGAYTLSIPSETYVEAADYLGMASGKTEDKFKTAGLTPVKSDQVNAPYVKEFPLILECRLIHTLEIGLHTQFVGEIVDIKADESVLAENGMPDIEKMKPILYAPAEKAYFSVGKKIGDAFSTGKRLK
ncbi:MULTISPECIES: flavin reductase family protein [Desulfotignum]|uniref:Flavoredoxin Flr n=2 Tax=Desulfotignum TaxID=115780 RepID=S0FTJ0_9BACT|nr:MULTISPECIES: flavin reductase family protein [Desulfotignum]EMS78010.1 flavoredoxin Flr [Desulfotignum phosphitoxidans DSM 13687]MBG0778833.1 flavin reductase family protein [Desulfotignum balticum]